MIYNEEKEEELEEASASGEPFADEEEPLIGLIGEISEEATQQVALMLLSFNGGKVLNAESPEERPEDLEFFISSSGGVC